MPFAKIKNLKINYIKKGKGEPLVLLHGLYCDIRGYKSLIKSLSNHFSVFAFDFPMHGKSEKPKKFLSICDFSDFVHQFCKKLKIKKPIILAHSGGALVAIEYTLKHKPKRLILVEPAGIRIYRTKLELLFRVLILKTMLILLKHPIQALNMIIITFYNFLKNLFNKNYHMLIDKEFSKDYSYSMKKIKIPTLILWSKNDEVVLFDYAGDYLKNIKNSKLIILKDTHDWPILKSKEILKIIHKLK